MFPKCMVVSIKYYFCKHWYWSYRHHRHNLRVFPLYYIPTSIVAWTKDTLADTCCTIKSLWYEVHFDQLYKTTDLSFFKFLDFFHNGRHTYKIEYNTFTVVEILLKIGVSSKSGCIYVVTMQYLRCHPRDDT